MFDLIDRAIGFAVRAHKGQQRKAGKMPYIAHPVGVAMLLQRLNCDDVVVAAALLHDTVEDTNATLDDVRAAFGDDVADIVAICTEPRGRWEFRKQTMIDRIHDAPLPAKLVAAADKYHNLSHVGRESSKYGETVWERFSRGESQQAWYYRQMLNSLVANVAEPERYEIFGMLAEAVADCFDGIVSVPPEER